MDLRFDTRRYLAIIVDVLVLVCAFVDRCPYTAVTLGFSDDVKALSLDLLADTSMPAGLGSAFAAQTATK